MIWYDALGHLWIKAAFTRKIEKACFSYALAESDFREREMPITAPKAAHRLERESRGKTD